MPEQMVSYADNFEDVLLRRAFADQPPGFYIDVGAFDPTEHSVTRHFYDRGWRGINVEPNPAPHAALVAGRPRDVNLNLGLSDREGTLRLFSAPSANACWSVDEGLMTGWFGARREDLVEQVVPVITLAQLCERHAPAGQAIDFLKVDVEGHEREVIAGGDWSRWRPRVVLCEANQPEGWDGLLREAGYLFALFEGVNRFYVREEDRDLLPRLSVPAHVGDNFLIHGYLARINALEQQLAACGRLGPDGLAVARRLDRIYRQHPRAAAATRGLFRMMGRVRRLARPEGLPR